MGDSITLFLKRLIYNYTFYTHLSFYSDIQRASDNILTFFLQHIGVHRVILSSDLIYSGQLCLLPSQNQANFPSFNDLLTHELIYMTENHASQNQSCAVEPKNELDALAKLKNMESIDNEDTNLS